MKIVKYLALITLVSIGLASGSVSAQQNFAQDAYSIFRQNCLNCHGPGGFAKDDLLIESAEGLIASGAVVQGKLGESELYTRLLEDDPAKRMPLGGQLSLPAIRKIEQWIEAGAPSWESQHDISFITTDTMLTAIQQHLDTLDPFDRPFARYFTITHLYNVGESPKRLDDYRAALSKLVNSLSWMEKITNPQSIDGQETIFYIDLRDYDWHSLDVWTQCIENNYPYSIEYDAELKAGLHAKLTNLREEMACEVPFVHVDWFLATASLPPLYHDILDLPTTDRELEEQLEIDVKGNLERTMKGNLQGSPERQVWRAGFSESGVSNHNRVVERHTSPYGAYWKSYDFAGSAQIQNVFSHPLTFRHDGGEIVFNLPNGLQAYYITDASGNRINAAPIEIVRNPETSDPTVRTGQSCIGCHAKGIQLFEDEVRAVTEKSENPPFDKEEVFRLYVRQNEMDAYLRQDRQRFKKALEATDNVFDIDGAEPVQFLAERFKEPLDATHAAAAVGLETEALLAKIVENPSLQNGLALLLIEGGKVNRDAWTSNFRAVVTCLYGEDCVTPVFTSIPDADLHAAIAEALGKALDDAITKTDLARLTQLEADRADIASLTGLEHATNLERIALRHNAISDLSPLADLTSLKEIYLERNRVTDVSPLAGLINVERLGLGRNFIKDLSPLKALKALKWLGIEDNKLVEDVSPLAGISGLRNLNATYTAISDFSPFANLSRLEGIEFGGYKSITTLPSLQGLKTLRSLKITGTGISDISGLSELTQLTTLVLKDNAIKDVSPLAGLAGLEALYLSKNDISDVSPLEELTNLKKLDLRSNRISDFSPLEGVSAIVWSEGNPGNFQQAGPKITGPWLWMIAPIGKRNGADAAASEIDFLKQMSNGTVTESKIATDGAIAGDPVGDKVWTSGEISPTEHNNLNKVANATGLGSGDINHHVAYGSLALDSPREQKTTMLVGSDDAVKIWLNGDLVHKNPTNRGADDYQDQFEVNLKAGTNILLVAVYEGTGGWTGFFGFKAGTDYTVLVPNTIFSISTDTQRIEIGTTFTVHLKAANVTDLGGWQTDVTFDPTVLKVNKVSEGNFLKQAGGDTYFERGTIQNQRGKIAGLWGLGDSRGGDSEGTLLSIEFTALASGGTHVTLRNFRAGSSTGKPIASPPIEMFIAVEGQPAAPVLLPEDTALFHNYPNPFNPETWIPYQLEQPSDVKIAIYAGNGQLVRMLNLGHQSAGYYIGRRRAAHWDGKNTVGEPVASGVYFYQLQADNLSFWRKMVILK